MRRVGSLLLSLLLAVCLLPAVPLDAQRARTTTKKPAPAPKPVPKTEPAAVTCPEELGTGLRTKASFCFVLAGRDPAEGVLVAIPPHTQATLTFDLHNRHTYSEEEIRAGRGYARYTAVIGVLTMSGALLGRGAVQTEFRAVKRSLRSHHRRRRSRRNEGGRAARARADQHHHSGGRRSGEPSRRSPRSHDPRRPRGRDTGEACRDRQRRAGDIRAGPAPQKEIVGVRGSQLAVGGSLLAARGSASERGNRSGNHPNEVPRTASREPRTASRVMIVGC